MPSTLTGGAIAMRELLTTGELAAYLQVSARTLIRWRVHRVGPPWTKVGRHVRYLKSDVDGWLERRRHEPEREAAQPRAGVA